MLNVEGAEYKDARAYIRSLTEMHSGVHSSGIFLSAGESQSIRQGLVPQPVLSPADVAASTPPAFFPRLTAMAVLARAAAKFTYASPRAGAGQRASAAPAVASAVAAAAAAAASSRGRRARDISSDDEAELDDGVVLRSSSPQGSSVDAELSDTDGGDGDDDDAADDQDDAERRATAQDALLSERHLLSAGERRAAARKGGCGERAGSVRRGVG